ncbi:acyl-CoA dehydrogenase family protein [Streptacidiphilus jiangxiensis]|uniref:Acyl-CoA dehydrogenase, N-terminal domain n=1 Tax=Streptacidiphilus jiangxiensis TaxID=235985 RepID=A0A1H7FBZ5_STRJI|nr:acyl-CoA dehydrogenase family protein [Streptacidiphilus jiangxiensis]SEK21570.1 Acyl-CoA dehydrogenase, N-terminal domain [Streptacidiphilus jiangxiensis]
MHFRLTDDQEQLRRALRELLADREASWAELTEVGLFSLRVPEDAGGLGLGLPEAVVAFEEAGRAVLPGPLVGTELAAAVLGLTGRAEVVRVPARGPVLVPDLPTLEHVLLLHADDALAVLPAAGLDATPVPAVDPDRPLWRLEGVLPLGEQSPQAHRVADEATLLTAALQAGLAARTVAEAVAYARTREQFGQPIGAFQAVQHLCADMLARAELARVAVYAAAVDGDEAEIVGAKLLADDAAVHGARDCLQVHGGMGFTWEARVHRLLKRAWAWEQAGADRGRCLDVLAGRL